MCVLICYPGAEVVPLEGTWIETFKAEIAISNASSFPLRERGLKLELL